jgi:hypothetical protein
MKLTRKTIIRILVVKKIPVLKSVRIRIRTERSGSGFHNILEERERLGKKILQKFTWASRRLAL